MRERLFYWLIDWLANFLGGLNPERRKKIEAIKAEGERLDALAKEAIAQREESKRIYAEEDAKRQEWDRRIADIQALNQESQTRFAAAQDRLKAREDEIKKINQAVLDRSDDERFGGVPKSNG